MELMSLAPSSSEYVTFIIVVSPVFIEAGICAISFSIFGALFTGVVVELHWMQLLSAPYSSQT